LAYRRHADGDTAQFSETDLVFVGLVGMIDPPREEAKTSVQRCREAGIRPVMITGDHPATALAIARELGIAEAGELRGDAITGRELEPLSDAELGARLDRTAVFARVSPEHKLRVVRAWQARGEIVAMTGDGVNDAPAVKSADIGIAMGASGTDVTREASDMVLLDDNFASIVNAVEEGRAIYDNIQKVLVYLLACNLGEILLLLGAGLVGWPLPLTPPQVLWINLVTDGIPALALAVVGPESDIMHRRPRPAREPILTRATMVTIVFRGLLCAGAGLGAFAIGLGGGPAGSPVARSMVFTTVVVAELLLALAARSRGPAFARSVFGGPVFLAVAASLTLQFIVSVVPVTRSAFAVASHSPWQWGVVVVLGALPLGIVEAGKALRSHGGGPTSRPVRRHRRSR
jgi:Ca2+-transporting ATPase